MKKTFFAVISFVVAMTVATSCSGVEEPAVADADNNVVSEKVTLNDNVKVLSYENYVGENDVNILSADTTKISVTEAYLEANRMTLNQGDVLSVWRGINQVPFIRIVDNVTVSGDVTTVTTHRGEITDVIRDGEIYFNCEGFVNASKSDGDGRYMSDSHTYHPVVVILDENKDLLKAPNQYATAEQLVARGEYSKTFTLYDKNIPVKKTFTTADKKITYGVDGYVNPSMKLEFYLNISSLKIKQFHAYGVGSVTASLPVTVKSSASRSWSNETTLYKSPKFSYVFKIGAVPVTITATAKVDFKGSASASNKFNATMPFTYNGSFTIGPKYVKDSGWSLYKKFSQSKTGGLKSVTISNVANVKASAAVYVSVSTTIYGVAGPVVTVGPKVSTDNTISILNKKFSLSSKGTFVIDGSVSAKLSILDYELAKWSKDFTLYSANIWNINKTYTVGGTYKP